MTLLTTYEDITSISSILQAIISLASVGLLYSAFALQAKTLREQMKITASQLKVAEVEIMRHRKEIMPSFNMTYPRKPYRHLVSPPGRYLLDLSFELNNNALKDFSMEIVENVGFTHYNGKKLPSVSAANARWGFVLQFEFDSEDGSIKKTSPQRHIIFIFSYKDVKNNQYQQTFVFVPELQPIGLFCGEPLLVKPEDLSH